MPAEVEDVKALILRKLGVTDATAVSKSFLEPEFIGEPLAWLYFFLEAAPKREDFVNEFDAPGRYVVAFMNGVACCYPHSTVEDRATLARVFSTMATSFFAWQALGGSLSEGRRMLRDVAGMVLNARKIVDELEQTIVLTAVGKSAAESFALQAAANRLQLTRRGTTALSSVLRLRASGTAAGMATATTTEEDGGRLPPPKTVTIARTNDDEESSPRKSDGSPRKKNRPGKRARDKKKQAAKKEKQPPIKVKQATLADNKKAQKKGP